MTIYAKAFDTMLMLKSVIELKLNCKAKAIVNI